MALFYECMLKCARKLLDTADIVRDGDLRGVLSFRNWFAHRRYTDPKPRGKYDFDSIYDLASSVLNSFPLQETDNRPVV